MKKSASILFIGILLLAAMSLVFPLPQWRTGRLPVATLNLVPGGPAIKPAKRVWVDTDASCGVSKMSDPDDCFALLLLASAPEIEIVGISTVFGNAPVADTDATTRELKTLLAEDGFALPPVFKGADSERSREATQATSELQRALANGPLTILALGPLTNVASALIGEPQLQENVVRIVAVMGRRPGHIFHPAEKTGFKGLLTHGPIFSDLNFRMDKKASAEILEMGVPISLVPYDAGRSYTLSTSNVAAIGRSSSAGHWIASQSKDWISFWRKYVDIEGFFPFDLVSAAYILKPTLFNCALLPAWIGPDDRLGTWFHRPIAFQAGHPAELPEHSSVVGKIIFCPSVEAALEEFLMQRLAQEYRD